MYIYKITNKINNKVYIGQTTKTISERFQRHKNDALSNRLNTHLAKAIRKYGVENFIIEQIDTAKTQQELTEKEYYWINFYDATHKGYNETDSMKKCGGNTYKNKTPQELAQISEKIRASKMGGKNPNAKKVKCKSIKTQKEYHFESFSEMQSFFKENQHNFITRRCTHKTKCLYKEEWLIAYEEEEYDKNISIYKNNNRAKPVKIIDSNEQEYIFPSFTKAEQEFHLPRGSISERYNRNKEKNFKYKDLDIIILK